MSEASTDLKTSIARSLDADPVLTPVLDYLLQDLDMLGAVPSQIVEVLQSFGPGDGKTALDLACGKGAVTRAVAGTLGFDITGIDAYEPFIDEAQKRAEREGLSDRCRFTCADIRDLPGQIETVDVVLLLSAGTVFGDAAETAAALRRFVPPGGLMVVEDAYATQPGDPLPGYDAIAAGLTVHGDTVVSEWRGQIPEAAEFEARAVNAIKRRCREMMRLYPGVAAALSKYTATQRTEAARLGNDLIPIVWVLRRAE